MPVKKHVVYWKFGFTKNTIIHSSSVWIYSSNSNHNNSKIKQIIDTLTHFCHLICSTQFFKTSYIILIYSNTFLSVKSKGKVCLIKNLNK